MDSSPLVDFLGLQAAVGTLSHKVTPGCKLYTHGILLGPISTIFMSVIYIDGHVFTGIGDANVNLVVTALTCHKHWLQLKNVS